MAAPAYEAMTPDQRGEELLKASETGNLEAVERLLAAGANKEAVNGNQETPLFVAAANGHADVVKRLLIAHVDRTGNARRNMEKLPLAAAVKGKHIEVIRHLLAAGVPIRSLNEGFMKAHSNEEINKLFNEFKIPRDYFISIIGDIIKQEVREMLIRRSEDLKLYRVGDKVFVPIESGFATIESHAGTQKVPATVVEVTPNRCQFSIEESTTYAELLHNKHVGEELLFLFQSLYPHLYPDLNKRVDVPAKYLEKPELLDILRSLNDQTDNFQQKHRKLLALYDQNDPSINLMLFYSTRIFGRYQTQGVKVEYDYSPGHYGYYVNYCHTGHFEYIYNKYTSSRFVPRDTGIGIDSDKKINYSLQQVIAIISWTNLMVPVSFYLRNPDLFKSIVNHPLVGNETIWSHVKSMLEHDYSALYHAATPTKRQRILYRGSLYWPTVPIRRRAMFPTSASQGVTENFGEQAKVIIPKGTRILDISGDFNPLEEEVIIFPAALTSPLDGGENHKLGSNMVIEPHENENVNEMGIKRKLYVIRNATEGNRNLPRMRRRTRRNNQNRRSTRRRRS